MADDFNPSEGTREVPKVTGNSQKIEVFPGDGDHVAVGLIVASSNKAEIKAKLAEIEALADMCTFKVWTAEALPGKRARVQVQGFVERTAPPE